MPPPPQEQGEEFGIWFASDRGIFENLPSGGGCNKENGWLDRTVGGGGGETYCAAVSRRRSERGIRSYEVRSQPRTFKYHILRVRKSAWSMAKYSHPPPPPLNSTRRVAQCSPLFLRRLIMLPPPPTFFWCLLRLSRTHTYYYYYTLARTRALMQKKSSRVCKKRDTFCVATAAGEKKPGAVKHFRGIPLISRNLILGCVKTRERGCPHKSAPIIPGAARRAATASVPPPAFNSRFLPRPSLNFPLFFTFFPFETVYSIPLGGRGRKVGNRSPFARLFTGALSVLQSP